MSRHPALFRESCGEQGVYCARPGKLGKHWMPINPYAGGAAPPTEGEECEPEE